MKLLPLLLWPQITKRDIVREQRERSADKTVKKPKRKFKDGDNFSLLVEPKEMTRALRHSHSQWALGGRYYFVRIALYEVGETMLQFISLSSQIAPSKDWTVVVLYTFILTLNFSGWTFFMRELLKPRNVRKETQTQLLVICVACEVCSDVLFIALSLSFLQNTGMLTYTELLVLLLPMVSLLDLS
jgi:hypothetical protein